MKLHSLLLLIGLFPFWAKAQSTASLSGVVQNEKNEPIVSVSITAEHKPSASKYFTASKANGSFTLDGLKPGSGYKITFSCVGYGILTRDIPEIKAGENKLGVIVLRSGAKEMDDVVVVGYGTQSKKAVSSAIATLKMGTVDQGAGNNPIQFLQGRATGVNITTPGGTPGTNPIVLIRGVSSITGGGAPLYVVDGVPTGTGYPNLNPNDIETLEVLKDASSAAIYGSRGNSGVVLITTKHGNEGKTKINFSESFGEGEVYHPIVVANVAQYTATMEDAVKNYDAQMGTSLTLYVPDTIHATDWVKAVTKSSPVNNKLNISASGGGKSNNFFTSFGYYGQQGTLHNTWYNQYNFRSNLNNAINSMITTHLSIAGDYTKQRLQEETSTSLKPIVYAFEEQPWYSPFNADGSYTVNGVNGIIRHNPVMETNEEDWTDQLYEGVGKFAVDFEPIKGLKFTPSINAYAYYDYNHKYLSPLMAARATTAGWGAVQINTTNQLRYNFDNVLSYTNVWKGLSYTALAGHTFEKYANSQFGAYSSNYAGNAYPSGEIDLISAGTNIYPATNGFDSYTLDSYFGRVNLSYEDKYVLNASLRSDGSSKFSQNERYGYFPAVSVGWNLVKESFMKNLARTFYNLKLRLSYGQTGSLQGIGSFANQSLASGGSSYNNSGGLTLTSNAQNLTWEKASEIDGGIDADVLKGRLSFTADYYSQKTTNLLYNRPIQATSGYTTIAANIGSMENKGLELGLNTKILTGKLKWDAGANVTFISNKLLSLYSGSSMYVIPPSGSNVVGGGVGIHALIDGKPVSAFYIKKQLGVYQSDSDVPTALYAKGVRAGDMIYQDVNHDGDITDADRQYAGKATPNYYGGFNTSLRFHGFELALFGQFSVGNKIYASWRGGGAEGLENLGQSFSTATLDNGSKETEFFNVSRTAATTYWKGPGTSNFMPRALMGGTFTGYSNGYNMETSTHYLENGSYLKLKTLTFAYNIPQSLLRKSRVEGVKVYASVNNFLTFTKYSGYDPEQSFATNPGDPNYGVDLGTQSALRTFLFGINLNL